MSVVEIAKHKPLTSHQSGIKIKNIVHEELKNNKDLIVLNFKDVDICTDSFIQQLTVILADEITFKEFKQRVKFDNLNDFLKDLVRSKLIIASKN